MRKRERPSPIDAQLGYAADRDGRGIAYVRLVPRRDEDTAGERLVRVPFRAQRFAGLDAREVGYAALTAVSELLHERGVTAATFYLSDGQLVTEVNEHRDVPLALVIPYVRLGCALNRFTSFRLDCSPDPEDLAQRARAEVALLEAA